MKALAVRPLDRTILAVLAILGIASVCSLALMPRFAHATTVTVSALTSTSTPLYVNTGLATTTRAKVGDTIQFYLVTTGGPPFTSPQINILNTGSTTMSSGGANAWSYSTTTTSNAAVWVSGAVPSFKISVGTTDGIGATTTVTALTSGPGVTFDSTSPTLNSVSWNDVDSSTELSAGDTLTLTFSETMATSTITTGNVDTTLGLSGSHTFGASPTVAWNTAGTVLTLTLGTSPTVVGGDTLDPTTAVKDAIGNADATPTPLAITDNAAPGTPTGLADTTFSGSATVTLASTGSSQIRYTTDGSAPNCSTGTVYTSPITITFLTTLEAVGCDEGNNASPVATAVYTHSAGSGGGGGGGGGSYHYVAPATVTSTTQPDMGCAPGNLFSATTGNRCSAPPTDCVAGNLFSASTGQPCPSTGTAPSGPASGGTSASWQFSTDLSLGSTGSDVQALQRFLNTHGYPVASSGPGSPGNETMTFGSLTQAAVIMYQTAKGITPAAGYFGPITRASVNSGQ